MPALTSVTLSPVTLAELRLHGTSARRALEAALIVAAATGDVREQIERAKRRPAHDPTREIVNVRLSPGLQRFRLRLLRRFSNFSAWADTAALDYGAEAGVYMNECSPEERAEFELCLLEDLSW